MTSEHQRPFSAQVLAVSTYATGLPASELVLRLRSPLDAQSNNLYDLFAGDRHLIVKQFLKEDELVDAPAREHSALLRLAEHDIAPQPVFYDATIGPVVVYEFMQGEMWDRRLPCYVARSLAWPDGDFNEVLDDLAYVSFFP